MGEDFSGSWFYRINRKIGLLRPFARVFARSFHHIDPQVYRLSAGRFTMTGLLVGLPVITLTTTGAKSGKKRSVPLIGIPDGDKIILIASNWGQSSHPSWYYNLRANSRVEVTSGRTKGDFIAREARGEEYDTYWKTAVTMYGGYVVYKRRNGGLKIPVIVLTPFEDS